MYTYLWIATVVLAAAPADARDQVIVVVGAPGSEDYERQFAAWADHWHDGAQQAGAALVRIGGDSASDVSDRERLQSSLQETAAAEFASLWLVLIGHGTFDGQQAKFNLRGPDVTADELAEWLKPIDAPAAIVNCASSSGPFVSKLSGTNRLIVTATKSGHEHHFARFGGHLAKAIADPEIDLDKDGQTSLLEAYLAASSRTAEFYDQQRRLATEHALLDDNGDGLGTPADWFRGVRATRAAKEGAAVDGDWAARFVLVKGEAEAALTPEVRQQRDHLESKVAALRSRKSELGEAAYYRQLEPLLVELARLYQAAASATDAGADATEGDSPAP